VPRQSDKQRHSDVLDAAITVMRDKGIQRASIRDIAEAAGMSKSSLFNYFSSKDDLIARLQGRMSEIARDELASVNLRSNLAASERLRELLKIHAYHCVERLTSPVLVTFMEHWGNPNSVLGREQLAVRDSYEQFFVKTLQECMDVGDFVAGNAQLLVRGMLGMTTWMSVWYNDEVDEPLSIVVDQFVDMCFNGLRKNVP